ncbi:hypothetical protein [Paractinoplanes hotanensis]|nr:hypothetical protein [Actinoplanes hotanensis]
MTRRDIALAMSLTLPYDVVAAWDDRIKATHWDLLEDMRDRTEE